MQKNKRGNKPSSSFKAIGFVSLIVGICMGIFGFILITGVTYFLSNTYNLAVGVPIAFIGGAIMFLGILLSIIGLTIVGYSSIGKTTKYYAEQTAPATEKSSEAWAKGLAKGIKKGLRDKLKRQDIYIPENIL